MEDIALEVVDTLDAVDAGAWNDLAGTQPFLQHAFLHALHETGCASRRTGWVPQYLLLKKGEVLAGAMPLYLKRHSRGEYVFDHSWAQAFEDHGIAYYPKLLSAIPFTPVTGRRLLAHDVADKRLLALGAVEFARQRGVSSLHILFPDEADQGVLAEIGYLVRSSVQFHWQNEGYADFDAFLGVLNQEKRKKLRQDRKKVAAAGIAFRWLRGTQIQPTQLAFFHRCYTLTYEAHWSAPYLSLAFFEAMHRDLPETMLLVLAERDGQPVAAALNVVGDGTLYGRYWGTTEFVSGLHFETCYAQSIAWCIANDFTWFEGGAQGEHKMARGLMPTPTASAHWIADSRFAGAIADFLDRETTAVEGYRNELGEHTPFRKAGVDEPGAGE